MHTAKHMHSDKHCQGAVDFWVGDRLRCFRTMKKKRTKDPHAVHLGRLGGTARKKKLTSEQRRDIARKAAQVRWKTEKPSEPS